MKKKIIKKKMIKKKVIKETPYNLLPGLTYLMHKIVSTMERMSDRRPIMQGEFHILHEDINLVIRHYFN